MFLSDRYREHRDLIAFGDHCIWTWECYQIAKRYCNDPSLHGWCEVDSHLAAILKEYALLQIAKIHDPASSGKNDNHSMRYYCERYGCNYEALLRPSEKFIIAITTARRKLIAHNDLEASRTNDRLGEFPDGADDQYFKTLRQALDCLYKSAGIGPFPDWPTFIEEDMASADQKMRDIGKRIRGY